MVRLILYQVRFLASLPGESGFFVDKRLIQQHQELYWEYAEDRESLGYVLFSPYLLWRWQQVHKKDVIRVATIASHKLGHHHWCKDVTKCATVEKYVIKNQRPPDLFVIKEHFQRKLISVLSEIFYTHE